MVLRIFGKSRRRRHCCCERGCLHGRIKRGIVATRCYVATMTGRYRFPPPQHRPAAAIDESHAPLIEHPLSSTPRANSGCTRSGGGGGLGPTPVMGGGWASDRAPYCLFPSLLYAALYTVRTDSR